MAGGYKPRHQTQLGRGPGRNRGTTDCGPRTCQMAADKATGGRFVPTIARIRDEMGVSLTDTTNVYDSDRAFAEFRIPYQRFGPGSFGEAAEAIKQGKGIQMCVAYGVITRLQYAKSGDKAFTGGHSLYLLGSRVREDDKRIVTDYDSLFDGRRSEIPKGPQNILLSTIRAAALAFGGGSKAYFGIIGSTRDRRVGGPGGDEDDEPDDDRDSGDEGAAYHGLVTDLADIPDLLERISGDESVSEEYRKEAGLQREVIRAGLGPTGEPDMDPEEGTPFPSEAIIDPTDDDLEQWQNEED